ncbi:MAG: SIS domain-containing protein [Rhodobacteraceae bacterium]|nr:SIS domain-containing protein [Paracoccaceae bacterium]
MPSLMWSEVREIPDAVAGFLDKELAATTAIADEAAARDPAFIVTVARGSSDHACSYLKYVAELTLGLPVASIGPSVASVYGAPLRLERSLCLAVSQSGKSPDIVEMARAARATGSFAIAVTNEPGSPLAKTCDRVLNIRAGREQSVAATKTFVTSAVAGLTLLASWRKDQALLAAIRRLPDRLADAVNCDWTPLAERLITAQSLYTLGRGPSFAISGEAALKFKETCQIHAENYSSAEVLHGPVSIVGQGFPILGLAAADAAEPGLAEVADAMAEKGASVFVTSERVRRAICLPAVRTGHPLTDPIALIASFYAMVEQVAVARGVDPDKPRHLRKVTETV